MLTHHRFSLYNIEDFNQTIYSSVKIILFSILYLQFIGFIALQYKTFIYFDHLDVYGCQIHVCTIYTHNIHIFYINYT